MRTTRATVGRGASTRCEGLGAGSMRSSMSDEANGAGMAGTGLGGAGREAARGCGGDSAPGAG